MVCRGRLGVQIALVLIVGLLLVACGGSGDSTTPTTAAGDDDGATTEATATTNGASGETVSLKVGTMPVPHGEILTFVQENLAAEAGIELELIEFTDYVQPNLALKAGELDANFFQHVPYMEDFGEQHDIDMVSLSAIHIEPLGIYSKKITTLDEVDDGAVVAIPNDVTNAGRALRLLEANGLLTLKEDAPSSPTVRDIAENPKNLKIIELEAPQLPRSLDDTTVSVINGNYAVESGLTPATDALALESAENNPYANVLTVLADRQDDPALNTLAELLNRPEVRQFIEERYEGSIIPAF